MKKSICSDVSVAGINGRTNRLSLVDKFVAGVLEVVRGLAARIKVDDDLYIL